jgi:glycosyltransferase 2 family protein
MSVIKKIFFSRIFRLILSLVLIYFAFKKVNVSFLWQQIRETSWWFLLINILLSLVSIVLISFRWSLLLIKKPYLKDINVFAKSSLVSGFYGLFFNTSVAGDLFKWILVDEKYPKIPKSKLLASIFLDRFIGLSMFVFVGTIMVFLVKIDKGFIPLWVKAVFLVLFVVCLVFYLLLFFGNLSKLKLWNLKLLNKIKSVAELVHEENKFQILKSLMLCLISEFFWIVQIWFISWYFRAGLSVWSIFIFLPIISMILALPISFAGFGAREQLYLLFFTALATSTESILLTSAFSGILGILMALIGGLVSLTPDFRKSRLTTSK